MRRPCAGAHGEVARARRSAPFDGRSLDDPFLICDIRCDLPDRGSASVPTSTRVESRPPGAHAPAGLEVTHRLVVPPTSTSTRGGRRRRLERRIRRIVGDRDHEGRVVHGLPLPLPVRDHDGSRTRDWPGLRPPGAASGARPQLPASRMRRPPWWHRLRAASAGAATWSTTYDARRRAAALDNLAITTPPWTSSMCADRRLGWARRRV